MLAQTPGSTYAFARGSAYLGGVASGGPPAGPPVRLRPRCPLALWRAPPHEQAYRRADEARRVTDRIDEVALVGEVQLARRVDLDRERRRGHGDLLNAVDPDRRAPRGHRPPLQSLAEDREELTRLDPLARF